MRKYLVKSSKGKENKAESETKTSSDFTLDKETITRNAIILLLLVTLDQILKIIVVRGFSLNYGFFKIQLVKNTGLLFGMLRNNSSLIAYFTLILLGFLLVNYEKIVFSRLSMTAMVLILAGLTSNTIDRLFFGYVKDFIGVIFWPYFNTADSFVVVGALLYVYSLIQQKNNSK